MSQPTQKKLTKKQKIFADEYIDTGIGVKAALKAYDTEDYNTAHAIASENLQKPTIQEYLADKSSDAASMIYKLSQTSKQDFIKLNASKDILDRSGYGAVQKSHIVTTQINLENKAFVEAVTLKANEQLLEQEIGSDA